MTLILTPSQTIGPFYGFAMIRDEYAVAAAPGDDDVFEIRGHVSDGDGPFVYPEGVLEFWAGDQFTRAQIDREGEFRVAMQRPTPAPFPNGATPAPHFEIRLFGRGLLKPLWTRMYFPDEAAANAHDPVLRLVPEARRQTLVARADDDRTLRFDIQVQGAAETVFFGLSSARSTA